MRILKMTKFPFRCLKQNCRYPSFSRQICSGLCIGLEIARLCALDQNWTHPQRCHTTRAEQAILYLSNLSRKPLCLTSKQRMWQFRLYWLTTSCASVSRAPLKIGKKTGARKVRRWVTAILPSPNSLIPSLWYTDGDRQEFENAATQECVMHSGRAT